MTGIRFTSASVDGALRLRLNAPYLATTLLLPGRMTPRAAALRRSETQSTLWKLGGFTREQKGNIEQKTNEILFRISPQGADPRGPTGWRRQLKKSVEIFGENSGEVLGEMSVLKDALGLGVLLLVIVSTQLASVVFGA